MKKAAVYVVAILIALVPAAVGLFGAHCFSGVVTRPVTAPADVRVVGPAGLDGRSAPGGGPSPGGTRERPSNDSRTLDQTSGATAPRLHLRSGSDRSGHPVRSLPVRHSCPAGRSAEGEG